MTEVRQALSKKVHESGRDSSRRHVMGSLSRADKDGAYGTGHALCIQEQETAEQLVQFAGRSDALPVFHIGGRGGRRKTTALKGIGLAAIDSRFLQTGAAAQRTLTIRSGLNCGASSSDAFHFRRQIIPEL